LNHVCLNLLLQTLPSNQTCMRKGLLEKQKKTKPHTKTQIPLSIHQLLQHRTRAPPTSRTMMAAIKTYDITWPVGPPKILNLALGTTDSNSWVLIHPTIEDEYEPREWSIISTTAVDDPYPAPSSNGNPVFALKNYSENKGLLESLERIGMIRHTGRRIPQGYVQLEMVEVLVPKDELIRPCLVCGQWEELGKPRYQKCGKCKVKYYCSRECQVGDWKEHKKLCKEGLTEEEASRI